MSKPKILELEEKITNQVIRAYQTKDKIVSDNMTINLEEKEIVGDAFSLENNAIKIGKGVTAIRVYGQIFYQYIDFQQNYFWSKIQKNGETIASKLTNYGIGEQAGSFCTADVVSEFVEVKEGDLITLNSGDIVKKQPTTRAGKFNTFLQVVKI